MQSSLTFVTILWVGSRNKRVPAALTYTSDTGAQAVPPAEASVLGNRAWERYRRSSFDVTRQNDTKVEQMTHRNARSMTDCRVLIIEDEYLLGDDLAKVLRSLGILVIGPVTELADAMSVERDSFDVAVVDINLRGCSAFPIADELMRVGKP